MFKKLNSDLRALKRKIFDLPRDRKLVESRYIHGESDVFFSREASSLKRALSNIFIEDGKIPTPNVNVVNNSTNSEKQEIEIVKDLKQNGYCVIENFVPSDVCERMISFAENTKSFPRQKDFDFNAEKQIAQKFKEPYLSARYDFSPKPELIFHNRDLQGLMANPKLYSIAENYLGSRPYLDVVDLWWFVPFPERDDAWAEAYHFDMDAPKWLKFFFNFEDIRYENGPHCFVQGTHSDHGIPYSLRKKGYSRLPDDEVFRHLDVSLERVFTLKAGSLLIEDSRGLHKGLISKSGRRLLFQYQLSNAVFVEDSDLRRRISAEFEKVKSFNDLIESHPQFCIKHFEGC